MGVEPCAHTMTGLHPVPALTLRHGANPPCVSFGPWDISPKHRFAMSCPITKIGAQRHAAETMRGNNDNWRLCPASRHASAHEDMLSALKDRVDLVSKINRDIEG